MIPGCEALRVEKFFPMLRCRQHAGVMFAKHPITIARHDLVDCVPKPARQYSADSCHPPNAPELSQHVKDRIGTRQQRFIGLPVIHHYINGVEIMRVYAVTRHQAVCKIAL